MPRISNTALRDNGISGRKRPTPEETPTGNGYKALTTHLTATQRNATNVKTPPSPRFQTITVPCELPFTTHTSRHSQRAWHNALPVRHEHQCSTTNNNALHSALAHTVRKKACAAAAVSIAENQELHTYTHTTLMVNC
mmetsp:Transcript_19637/g.54766  ORF Transcript_19637/g.54766 Transcript_19637/m.54766 type:complete len:138 (-) Transcript_19637:2000-2413(-)